MIVGDREPGGGNARRGSQNHRIIGGMFGLPTDVSASSGAAARVFVGPGCVSVANGRASGSIGVGSVVEHSVVRAPSKIGKGSVVSQSIVLNKPIDLADDRLLFQVPVKTRDGKILHVHVLCGVEDDFKGRFDQGKCMYLNRPIDEWMKPGA